VYKEDRTQNYDARRTPCTPWPFCLSLPFLQRDVTLYRARLCHSMSSVRLSVCLSV